VYRRSPFRELWEQDHEYRKFTPQEGGHVETQDTPMVDAVDQT